jgi:hypothetical protein
MIDRTKKINGHKPKSPAERLVEELAALNRKREERLNRLDRDHRIWNWCWVIFVGVGLLVVIVQMVSTMLR